MEYGDIFTISLYRVIGRIRMLTLHLGAMNEESDTGGRTWDRVHDVSAKIRCPCGLGVGICTWLCVYAFGEEFSLGIDPKSLHATVLMQTVYNAVVRHSRGFLNHVVISVTEQGRITVVA